MIHIFKNLILIQTTTKIDVLELLLTRIKTHILEY